MHKANFILAYLLLSLHLSCNSPSSLEPENVDFMQLEVGDEWLYAKWEQRHNAELAFTGDTLSVRIIAKDDSTVTFHETPVGVDSIAAWDSTTFRFRIDGTVLRQIGHNDSRVFGFVRNHDGILNLEAIDSNRVDIDFDASLFSLRDQVNQPRFIGTTSRVDMLSSTYRNVNVYYDQTPTYVDGFGHLALFSPELGVVATIYFGGYSPIARLGYQLIR